MTTWSQEPYVMVSNFTNSTAPSEWFVSGDDTSVSHDSSTLSMEVVINTTSGGGGDGNIPGEQVVVETFWIVPHSGEIQFSYDWNDGTIFPNSPCLTAVYGVDDVTQSFSEYENFENLTVTAGQVLSIQIVWDTAQGDCAAVGVLEITNFRYLYPDNCPTDLNKDGETDTSDLLQMLAKFGCLCVD